MEDDDVDTGHGRPSLEEERTKPMQQELAFVGLGGNIGDVERTLTAAVHALAALPGARLSDVSRLYATVPVGVTEQAEFRNAAVALSVPAGPDPETGALALLLALKSIEKAFGRQARQRWGPRELDLDLLVFGDHRVRLERPTAARSQDPVRAGVQWLEVPHRATAQRLFVLAPLTDLAPDLVPPGWPETVAEACRRRVMVEGSTAVRATGAWSAADGCWLPLANDERPTA
ncbi:MAG: 2-amino-4-hydroxy-6-hydroxymethyldihydropteridine diphosphokinase [Chloroflexi bacterium]|nr:2-amino-4-hydroxy-6-hydroxymethyldihydropteridine diphosphokinase [Chloroflexota bacterium]